MGIPLKPMKKYMREVIEEHRDPLTDEINSTTLAEDASDTFNVTGPNGEVDERIFWAAYEVERLDEASRKGIICSAVRGFINSVSSTAM